MGDTRWIVKPFKDCIEKIIDHRGKTPKKLKMSWGNGDILALSANNVKNGKIDTEAEAYYGSEELYNKWMTTGDVEKGDVVMTMEAPLGNVTQIPDNDKYILSQRVAAFKTIPEIDNNYFSYYLSSNVFQNLLDRFSTGTTAKGISQKNLRPLQISYPSSIVEQQKIAAILSSVDEAIDKTEQIIEQTETVKKGLMQKLLMKGIEHTEFKNSPFGQIPTNWEVLKVNDFAVVDYGISEAVSNNTDPSIGIPIITGANITLDGKLDMSKKVYINKRDQERFKLRNGDLLFNWRSGSQHHVGKTAIFNCDEDYTFASFILKIRVNNECNNKFYYYLLNYLKSIQYFSKDTSVQVNFKLNASSFRELLLIKPPLEEQREISLRIDSIYEKIEFEKAKVNKLNEIKQGLMQQLLTGKVRVPLDDKEEVPS